MVEPSVANVLTPVVSGTTSSGASLGTGPSATPTLHSLDHNIFQLHHIPEDQEGGRKEALAQLGLMVGRLKEAYDASEVVAKNIQVCYFLYNFLFLILSGFAPGHTHWVSTFNGGVLSALTRCSPRGCRRLKQRAVVLITMLTRESLMGYMTFCPCS